ncbi:MAG: hypothetical protein V7K27_00150 [Nostoc sp.]|uniref:hypothetical protein n=1 Tax=Nostoc sp. TaxID=1180 RepID=UPI002FF7F3A8
MKTSNGTTQDLSGRRKNGKRKDESVRLGKHGQDSPINGTEQIGATSADSSGEDIFRTTIAWDGHGDAGKILEEVLLLKQQFLDYVKSHQGRLEARLDESKQQEQKFLTNAEGLELRLRKALAIQQIENESDNPEEPE